MRHTATLAILLIASVVVGILLFTSHNSASAASALPVPPLECVDCEAPVRIQEGDSYEVPQGACLIVERIGFQLPENACTPPAHTVVVDLMEGGTTRVQGAMFYYAPVLEDGAGPMGVLPMLSIEPGIVFYGEEAHVVSVRDLTFLPGTGCVASGGTQAQAFGRLVAYP